MLEPHENKETTCKDTDESYNTILRERSQQKMYILDKYIKNGRLGNCFFNKWY